MFLHWTSQMSANNFQAVIQEQSHAARAAGCTLFLIIDKSFIENFLRVDDETASQVLQVIQEAPITKLSYDEGAVPELYAGTPRAAERFDQLCGALRVLVIENVMMSRQDGIVARLVQLLESLPFISNFHLMSHPSRSSDDIPELVASLRDHPTISEVHLAIQPGFYRQFLPVLQTLPMLRNLELENPFRERPHWLGTDLFGDYAPGMNAQMHAPADDGADEVDIRTFGRQMEPVDSEALHGLLRMDTVRELRLGGLDFTAEVSHQHLCDGIDGSRLTGIVFDTCQLHDGPSLVDALSSLQDLSIICLYQMRFVGNTVSLFLSALAAELHLLPQLKIINCDIRRSGVEQSEADVDGVATLVRCASVCPRLMRLSLQLWSYSASMDSALAECVRVNRQLQFIGLQCEGHTEGQAAYSPLALCAALRSNYTMEMIGLTKSLTMEPLRDPWDAAIKRNISAMLRLNVCGRNYLAIDPVNRQRGVAVLALVTDDLDSLFIHLRENPVLCSLSDASVAATRVL